MNIYAARLENVTGPLTPSERTCLIELFNNKVFEATESDPELRGEFLAALCTDGFFKDKIPPCGIQIEKATITGRFDAKFCKIDFPLSFKKCHFHNKIILTRATTSTINLKGSTLSGFNATSATINGSLDFSKTKLVKNSIKIFRSKIAGSLLFINCNYDTPNKTAIKADGIQVGGHVNIKNSTIQNTIKFIGATIHTNFNVLNSTIAPKVPDKDSHTAIKGERLRTGGNVKIEQSTIAGKTKFINCTIEASFFISNLTASTHNASRVLDLSSSRIMNKLQLAKKIDVAGPILLKFCRVDNAIEIIPAMIADNTLFNLEFTKTRIFRDNLTIWSNNQVIVTHFTYENLPAADGPMLDARLRALAKQPRYIPQPYEQLALVLKNDGYQEETVKVLIEKCKRKTADMPVLDKIWNKLLGLSIGYGYKPLRPLFISLVWIIAGTFIFSIAYDNNLMTPIESKTYICGSKPAGSRYVPPCDLPQFLAITYSVDAFIPVVNLYQAEYWLPNTSTLFGKFTTVYHSIHILAGWIFTTLFLLGISGLVKK